MLTRPGCDFQLLGEQKPMPQSPNGTHPDVADALHQKDTVLRCLGAKAQSLSGANPATVLSIKTQVCEQSMRVSLARMPEQERNAQPWEISQSYRECYRSCVTIRRVPRYFDLRAALGAMFCCFFQFHGSNS